MTSEQKPKSVYFVVTITSVLLYMVLHVYKYLQNMFKNVFKTCVGGCIFVVVTITVVQTWTIDINGYACIDTVPDSDFMRSVITRGFLGLGT